MSQRGIPMRHKPFMLIVVCIFVVLLSGCWDREELQQLSIVSGMAIDKGSDKIKNRYRVTVQIINPSQVAGGQQGGKVQASPVTTFTETGSTLAETLRKISTKSPGELFFPHLQVLVIGEKVAKEGIEDLFDMIERDAQFRVLFPVLIARGHATAKETLEVTTSLEAIPSAKIGDALKSSEEDWGTYKSTRADQVIQGLKEGSVVVTGIKIDGERKSGNATTNMQQISPSTQLEINGMAIFKNGKLENWLEGHAARGVTWITNEMKRTVINLNCGKKKEATAIEISRAKSSTHVTIKHQKPVIYITVHAEGAVLENNCSKDLGKSKVLGQLDEQLEEEIKQEVLLTVKRAQKQKSDIFNFGEKVNMADKRIWKNIETSWEKDIFPETEVYVNVQAIIRRTGMTTKSYLNK
ncbi:Ger(x)C family spore germination protein [Priestia megaterium]|uniref:Ger(x)C family spore germination protein n=1 Tax=Priestia megaterium TaxID=1404 RepID=UPI00244A2F3D|nr:Ger(x)C family spore germination protein [Priestia megaterium]MDH2363358.1 Ger(x)C family spore germination protein [Priestia megaterium]MDR7246439.1 spore germination protein KC [Priestia megaterium]